jgi:hypothetical protein
MLATLGPLPLGEGWSSNRNGMDSLPCASWTEAAPPSSAAEATTSHICVRGLGPRPRGHRACGPHGEIVAFQGGQQSFEALQGVIRRRLGFEDVAFLAFDLLWLRGRSLQRAPYLSRSL